MNKLLSALQNSMGETTTEKGAKAYISTNSPLLDFFALGGATRTNKDLGLDLFKKAFSEDHTKAIRILFYFRDIRGGQGERDLFRNCISWLASKDEGKAIVEYIPEYGRFDDMLCLLGTEVQETVIDLIKKQLIKDMQSETPSLLGKWLPSENTSSKETRKKARLVRNALGATEKEYRQTLSSLRKKIRIVETNLSSKEYKTINYAQVPSQASLKYRSAFGKHDTERYAKYLENVKKGEVKINTSTLYPHQVYLGMREGKGEETLETLWSNLPDYTQGNKAIVVADVSGSMLGEPMAVAVSLALYFAERNVGPFQNHFITFSEHPVLQVIRGDSLRDKMNSIESSNWGGTTDYNKVFANILATAVTNKLSQDEMPRTLYTISDMQFDQCERGVTNFEYIKEKFRESGYEMPQLVFWNVRAANKNVPVKKDQRGVSLVSGFSPSTFKLVMENKTPLQLMEEVINSPRYSNILA